MAKSDMLRPWEGRPIAAVALGVSGKNFELYNQPAREFDPDEVVYIVAQGVVDAKVSYERTNAGLWVRNGSISVTRCYELGEDAAKPMLDDGERVVMDALDRRTRISSVA